MEKSSYTAYLEELENNLAIVMDDQGRFSILLVRPNIFELGSFFHFLGVL